MFGSFVLFLLVACRLFLPCSNGGECTLAASMVRSRGLRDALRKKPPDGDAAIVRREIVEARRRSFREAELGPLSSLRVRRMSPLRSQKNTKQIKVNILACSGSQAPCRPRDLRPLVARRRSGYVLHCASNRVLRLAWIVRLGVGCASLAAPSGGI